MVHKAGMVSVVRVADIMTEGVVTIRHDATLDEAQATLTEHQVSGAPVVQGRQIVGVLSATDLVDPRKDFAVKVGAIMTKVVFAVRRDDPVVFAVQLMVQENLHRVVVVDDQGSLVGIVTAHDVMRAIVDGKAVGGGGPAQVEFVDLRKLGG